MSISKEDLQKIIDIYTKIKKEHGQEIETGVLYDEENPEGEFIIDNRKDKDKKGN